MVSPGVFTAGTLIPQGNKLIETAFHHGELVPQPYEWVRGRQWQAAGRQQASYYTTNIVTAVRNMLASNKNQSGIMGLSTGSVQVLLPNIVRQVVNCSNKNQSSIIVLSTGSVQVHATNYKKP